MASLAHLPWLQEMPDALTTAMWSSAGSRSISRPAQRLGIQQGDLVEVESQHREAVERSRDALAGYRSGRFLGMPIGQGHTNFSRYATDRGSNPLSILAPVTDVETGSLGLGGDARQNFEAGWSRTSQVDSFLGRGEPLPASGRAAIGEAKSQAWRTNGAS